MLVFHVTLEFVGVVFSCTRIVVGRRRSIRSSSCVVLKVRSVASVLVGT